jgi:hypothetical protein
MWGGKRYKNWAFKCEYQKRQTNPARNRSHHFVLTHKRSTPFQYLSTSLARVFICEPVAEPYYRLSWSLLLISENTHRFRIKFPFRWLRFSLRTRATAALTWARVSMPEQSLSRAYASLSSAGVEAEVYKLCVFYILSWSTRLYHSRARIK